MRMSNAVRLEKRQESRPAFSDDSTMRAFILACSILRCCSANRWAGSRFSSDSSSASPSRLIGSPSADCPPSLFVLFSSLAPGRTHVRLICGAPNKDEIPPRLMSPILDVVRINSIVGFFSPPSFSFSSCSSSSESKLPSDT